MERKRNAIEEAIAEWEIDDDDALTAAGAPPSPTKLPVIRPWPNSGLYLHTVSLPPVPQPIPQPKPIPVPGPEGASLEDSDDEAATALSPAMLRHEILRLDVDGTYPQMQASGEMRAFKIAPAHWIARLKRVGVNTYEGPIWYRRGNVSLLPFSAVRIVVSRNVFGPKSAKLTFSGGGVPTRVVTLAYRSRYFHPVHFEFDFAEGVTPTLSYHTGSHPNRPSTLAKEKLSIAKVYQRAGFDVRVSGGSMVPIAAAGADRKWSDAEMHDAMQKHWSRFVNAPQWAMWVFFASLHESGRSLGGIMFDDLGPNHRQGTALFVDSFVKDAPAGDVAPAAWVARMIFWTACHEMGHGFNLAHSWQKALGTPWIPLANEPLARSFMNYPYNVPGSTTAFFGDFEFRFSDSELLFLRHAPEAFVQPGNADWFDHHGFEDAEVSPEPCFSLQIEAPRAGAFEFLEPVVVDLTLTNISSEPQLVSAALLKSLDGATVVIKRRGGAARELVPFSHACFRGEKRVLSPGESIRESVFLVGRNGWDIAEPGYYTVQASLRVGDEDVVSPAVQLRVAPPRSYDEEYLAQDVFSQGVGRVFNFDGSRYLESANEVLRELVERLPKTRAAIHARVALAAPLADDYKQTDADAVGKLTVARANPAEARRLIAILAEDPKGCTATLGKVDYAYYADRFQAVLASGGKGGKRR